MIIDGHAHAARKFSDVDSLLKELERCGVDKVILCPTLRNRQGIPNPPGFFKGKKERDVHKLYAGNPIVTFLCKVLPQNGDSNAFVHAIQQKAPERVIQFYWVDFNSPTVLEDLPESVNRYQCRGFKIHQAWTPFDYNSSQFESVLTFAQEQDLPLFIHPGSEEELEKLIPIAHRFSGVNFIISHLMGLHVFRHYEGDNVYHDISPEDLLTGNIYSAIKTFGADKIIFGSDMPFGNLKENVIKVQTLDLSDDVKKLILGGNIQRLLKLEK